MSLVRVNTTKLSPIQDRNNVLKHDFKYHVLNRFQRATIPVQEILYVAGSKNLGQGSKREISLPLISLTMPLLNISVTNEITQDKVTVLWESVLWKGLHLSYLRISTFFLDKYVKNSRTF